MFQLNHKKEMTTKIKIGIVGSRKYTDKRRIKDLIFEIKEKYGDGVEIVSGGQKDGADGFAKKYALEFDRESNIVVGSKGFVMSRGAANTNGNAYLLTQT